MYRNGVYIVADEIHCELVSRGIFIFLCLSFSRIFSHSVTCNSPSKAFNIAGLQIANIIVPDNDMRTRIDRAININEVCDVNPFGVEALIAAYNEGEEWLSQLLAYLKGNDDFMWDFCRQNLPQFPLTRLEGTYLEWMGLARLSVLHRQNWRNGLSTKPVCGSMPVRCMGPKAKDSCVGTLLVPAPVSPRDWNASGNIYLRYNKIGTAVY